MWRICREYEEGWLGKMTPISEYVEDQSVILPPTSNIHEDGGSLENTIMISKTCSIAHACGIAVDLYKVNTILQWETPMSVFENRSFLVDGLLSKLTSGGVKLRMLKLMSNILEEVKQGQMVDLKLVDQLVLVNQGKVVDFILGENSVLMFGDRVWIPVFWLLQVGSNKKF
ncbi:hypothetical protein MTR_4g046820 [Medicago truncatula]|uniref:Uncharacterized protein n=1 Tax=Medicago truncatula TaxID=3880 RepID=A0A072UKN9_MEDTR|nr:hypothetical protein MTR_4g046820 [Medicago truncatula]